MHTDLAEVESGQVTTTTILENTLPHQGRGERFVHAAQYERLGREGFLQEYIQQIAERGYADVPFELEAEAKASRRSISEMQTSSLQEEPIERVVAVNPGMVDRNDLR